LLPYRKPIGTLEDFEVFLEEKTREVEIDKRLPAITEKSTRLELIEYRSKKKYVSAVFDTSYHDVWGGKSSEILWQIKESLNCKSDYEWREIEEILICFLKKEAKYGTFDYTLGCLTSLIGDVLKAKYEITRKEFEDLIRRENYYERDINLNVFSKLKIYKEIESTISSERRDEDKGKAIIDAIAEHHYSFFWPYTIIEPDYEDEFNPVYGVEENELHAMERILERELKKIEQNNVNDQGKHKLLREEIFNTAYYRRIESFEQRRVHGGGISFGEKEERIRKEARKISEELKYILLSWGINNFGVLNYCVSYYWDLFEEKAWSRQQEETKDINLENKWKNDIEEIKRIQAGQWDSNTLTLFGVIIAIYFSLLFGLSSLCWYLRVLIALAISCGLVFTIKIKHSRTLIIMFMTKILSSAKRES
jgi:hypothetical protein